MLKLPDVTLVCYEIKAHELVAQTLRDAMAKVEFANVILWTDKKIDVDCEQILVSANAKNSLGYVHVGRRRQSRAKSIYAQYRMGRWYI